MARFKLFCNLVNVPHRHALHVEESSMRGLFTSCSSRWPHQGNIVGRNKVSHLLLFSRSMCSEEVIFPARLLHIINSASLTEDLSSKPSLIEAVKVIYRLIVYPGFPGCVFSAFSRRFFMNNPFRNASFARSVLISAGANSLTFPTS